MKKYETFSIDECTFYCINGEMYSKVNAIKNRRGSWVFCENDKIIKLRKQFFSGNPQVKLNNWLNIRTQIKYEQSLLLSIREDTGDDILDYGKPYYFVEDNIVKKNYYGKSGIHKLRIANNNFYLTQEEALKNLKTKN